MYDLIIRNGMIADGSGGRAYPADLAVAGGAIAEIAPRIGAAARRFFDADGKCVAPGFIDVHTHDDLVLFDDPWNKPKLLQGVTTVVAGNCGFGPWPANAANRQALADYAAPILGRTAAERSFQDFAAYAGALEALPKAQNIAVLAAHGALYIAENGFNPTGLDGSAAARAGERLAAAMRSGALGMSVGFMYAPGCYCGRTEMLPFAGVVADHGGLLCVHLKSESEFIDAAIGDVLAIQRASGVGAHISHLKIVGKPFRGRMAAITEEPERLSRAGADITFDMYPYTAGSTTLAILFPIDMLADGIGGCLALLKNPERRAALKREFGEMWRETDNLALLSGWENVIVSSLERVENESFVGRSLADIAAARGVSPEDACIDLFEQEEGRVAVILNHIDEEDMRRTILSPLCIVVSDGIPGGAKPHPRLYGSFPRFLRRFVREGGGLELEQAVRKITALPAERFGLGNRGRLLPGAAADIVVFDPAGITDRATFEQPRQFPEGIFLVAVGGEIVCEAGATTGAMPGRFLRRDRKP